MDKLYPVMLDLTEKLCIVVGGGKVALRKIKTLLDNNPGVLIKIISPFLCQELEEILKEENYTATEQLTWVNRKYKRGDVQGAFLVYACTGYNEVNVSIAREAREKGILVNCVSMPEESNFIVPASVVRGDLTISISTGGKSPALSKKIREKIEDDFSGHWERYIDFLGYCRKEIQKNVKDHHKRKEIYYELLEDDSLFEKVKKANDEKLKDLSLKIIEEYLK